MGSSKYLFNRAPLFFNWNESSASTKNCTSSSSSSFKSITRRIVSANRSRLGHFESVRPSANRRTAVVLKPLVSTRSRGSRRSARQCRLMKKGIHNYSVAANLISNNAAAATHLTWWHRIKRSVISLGLCFRPNSQPFSSSFHSHKPFGVPPMHWRLQAHYQSTPEEILTMIDARVRDWPLLGRVGSPPQPIRDLILGIGQIWAHRG